MRYTINLRRQMGQSVAFLILLAAVSRPFRGLEAVDIAWVAKSAVRAIRELTLPARRALRFVKPANRD